MTAAQPAVGATPSVAILGAGVSGLCMGIQLLRAGITSFTILEKSDRVGGTWYDNQYPGAACDVPSHFYCYSFEPNSEWTRKFSPQPEIQRYLARCAEKYGLLSHIRFRTEVSGASWGEREGVWRIRTADGQALTANVLVSGVGQLNRPHTPDLPGLSDFEGTVFHSARWNQAHDTTGRRVAVIGNGASAIQFIPPVAKQAKQLIMFQRSANWVVPRGDYAYSERAKAVFRRLPWLLVLYRWFFYWQLEKNFLAFGREGYFARGFEKGARAWLEQSVSDPALREILTPDYRVGCKRILIDDDFYPALARPNVAVETGEIARITRDAIETKDGKRHEVDTIILATGFETTTFLAPMEIEGTGGKKLLEVWGPGAEAHLGITVTGFPNFFMLYGPNTNLGHNSIIFMIECQVGYAVRAIRELARRGWRWLDVRADVQERYNARIQQELSHTAWAAGCKSWYKTAAGKVTNNWSSFTLRYWWQTRRPAFEDYRHAPRT